MRNRLEMESSLENEGGAGRSKESRFPVLTPALPLYARETGERCLCRRFLVVLLDEAVPVPVRDNGPEQVLGGQAAEVFGSRTV